jgi:hypothetical protein
MGDDKWYPKRIEHFAFRNFNVGDRVKAYFKGAWHPGVVVKKYKKEKWNSPYILIKTDERIADESHFLGGFGLEGKVASPKTIFEHEPIGGDEIYRRTYERELTEEEKIEEDNCPF